MRFLLILTDTDVAFFCCVYLFLSFSLITTFIVLNKRKNYSKIADEKYKNVLNLNKSFMTIKHASLHILLVLFTLTCFLEILYKNNNSKSEILVKSCNTILIFQNILTHWLFYTARVLNNKMPGQRILFVLFLISFVFELIKIFILMFEILYSINKKYILENYSILCIEIVLNIILLCCVNNTKVFSEKLYLNNCRFQQTNHLNMIWIKIQLLKPFLVPNSFKLKLYAIVCLLSVLTGRIINLILPIIFNQLLDNFNKGENCNRKEFLSGFCYFIIITFLQGHPGVLNGFLGVIKSFFWIPVKQNIKKLVSLKVYSHILNLNYDQHIHFQIGELLNIIDKSGNSIEQIINYMIFNVSPPLVDLVISILYFSNNTNYAFAAIVSITFISYTSCTYFLSSWKESLKRKLKNDKENNDCCLMNTLMNFEIVKNYRNENYELNRFKSSLKQHQVNLFKFT
uniref:ATP-binding cassette sub-family B member 6, mitochondrial (Trinotate prediction) n=1 Tax=Henneguya salminicola TaxID=69463 RepID=A0A6G3MDW2_HENSL